MDRFRSLKLFALSYVLFSFRRVYYFVNLYMCKVVTAGKRKLWILYYCNHASIVVLHFLPLSNLFPEIKVKESQTKVSISS